jgi:hypothetical protein
MLPLLRATLPQLLWTPLVWEAVLYHRPIDVHSTTTRVWVTTKVLVTSRVYRRLELRRLYGTVGMPLLHQLDLIPAHAHNVVARVVNRAPSLQ